MPYFTLVAGTTITASWANANIRDQVVTPFATTAARASAITSPVNGMLASITDDDTLTVYNGSAWEVIASYANWIVYAPSHTNITKGNGTEHAYYLLEGSKITVHWNLVLGSTSAIAAGATVGLPFTSASRGFQIGAAWMIDSGSRHYAGCIRLAQGTTGAVIVPAEGGAADGLLSATAPFTWTTGDELGASIVYEGT